MTSHSLSSSSSRQYYALHSLHNRDLRSLAVGVSSYSVIMSAESILVVSVRCSHTVLQHFRGHLAVLLRQHSLMKSEDGLHPYWILALVDKETKAREKSDLTLYYHLPSFDNLIIISLTRHRR